MLGVFFHRSSPGFRCARRGRDILRLMLPILLVMAAVSDRRWAMAPAAAQCVLSIRTRLSDGTTGEAYLQRLSAVGGVGPYTYTLDDGSLPPGLTLSLLGTITGTPTVEGSYRFTVRIRDALNCVITQALTI